MNEIILSRRNSAEPGELPSRIMSMPDSNRFHQPLPWNVTTKMVDDLSISERGEWAFGAAYARVQESLNLIDESSVNHVTRATVDSVIQKLTRWPQTEGQSIVLYVRSGVLKVGGE